LPSVMWAERRLILIGVVAMAMRPVNEKQEFSLEPNDQP